MVDSTVPSFPSYAELTQTQAWVGDAPVRIRPPAPPQGDARYVEGAVLGVGGMGKVVLARDARIGREVAVKVLLDESRLSEEDRARFLREAQVQGQLEHPSIVPVYDIDRRPDGTTFFTMRRVLGRTLAALLDDHRNGKQRHTQRELLQAFATVCLAIDYAHERGVVHRDLKPANIMLGEYGEVYVLDWGIARLLDPAKTVDEPASRLSVPGTMMGTPLYMAPEQMADPDVGPSADIYALGAILFEILTLERVREARAIYAPVEARPSVRTPDRNVAPELEAICVKATELEATDRFPSARAMQEAIARYLEGDRELEQRRTLAAGHATRAREVLAKDDQQERGVAMRELVRALALDPTNAEYVALLAEIMSTPPRQMPAELEAQSRAEAQSLVRFGSRYSGLAILSWFLFLPVLLALGIRRFDYLLAIAIPAALSAALSLVAARQRVIDRPIQYGMVAFMILAAMALSRLFGPLILAPIVLATWCIVVQAHPDARLRVVGLAGMATGIALPVVLELVGLLPSSYAFEGGRFIVLPQLTELPREITVGFLAVANIATALLPAVFVAKLRADLSAAQQREQLQSWNFRQLGADLIRAGAR